jgi:hypothetical protein
VEENYALSKWESSKATVQYCVCRNNQRFREIRDETEKRRGFTLFLFCVFLMASGYSHCLVHYTERQQTSEQEWIASMFSATVRKLPCHYLIYSSVYFLSLPVIVNIYRISPNIRLYFFHILLLRKEGSPYFRVYTVPLRL